MAEREDLNLIFARLDASKFSRAEELRKKKAADRDSPKSETTDSKTQIQDEQVLGKEEETVEILEVIDAEIVSQLSENPEENTEESKVNTYTKTPAPEDDPIELIDAEPVVDMSEVQTMVEVLSEVELVEVPEEESGQAKREVTEVQEELDKETIPVITAEELIEQIDNALTPPAEVSEGTVVRECHNEKKDSEIPAGTVDRSIRYKGKNDEITEVYLVSEYNAQTKRGAYGFAAVLGNERYVMSYAGEAETPEEFMFTGAKAVFKFAKLHGVRHLAVCVSEEMAEILQEDVGVLMFGCPTYKREYIATAQELLRNTYAELIVKYGGSMEEELAHTLAIQLSSEI